MVLENARRWQDVFSDVSCEAAIKKRYHKLAKTYHSDNLMNGNSDLFRKLTEYYNLALNNLKGLKSSVITFRHNGKSIRFEYKAKYEVAGCEVYYGDNSLAVVFSKDMQDLADRFIDMVNGIEIPGNPSDKEHQALRGCLPVVKERYGGLVIINKTSEVINLGKFVQLVDAGEIQWNSRDRHATWIVNRLYLLWNLMEYNNRVFMGFDINNMFISPKYHTVLPLLGWQFAVGTGEKLVGTTGDILNIMDPVTISNKIAETYIDGDSIKLIAKKVFGKTSWKELDDFLERVSTNPQDDWDEFTSIFEKHFGGRKYFEMEVDNNEFYMKGGL